MANDIKSERQKNLNDALRENLKKRKAQVRKLKKDDDSPLQEKAASLRLRDRNFDSRTD